MTVVCAIFTLVLGLDIWFETLKTRENLAVIWGAQPQATQSLIQQTVRIRIHKCHFRLANKPSAQLLWLHELHISSFRPGCHLP
jgi:hypothetical protein